MKKKTKDKNMKDIYDEINTLSWIAIAISVCTTIINIARIVIAIISKYN